ncbi:MAG: hypothetical protein JKY54_19750, partial [Flavobacteriales bacterium]|nr:hypothetical protein [Flavobacteriales bacterium]
MTNSYQNRYTWSHGFSTTEGEVLEHSDGTISICFEWDGIDTAMKSQAIIKTMFDGLNKSLHKIDENTQLTVENHFLRDHYENVSQEYLDYGEEHIVRHHKLGRKIRQDIAETTNAIAMRSRIFTVFTLSRRYNPFSGLFAKKELKKTKQLAKTLIDAASEMAVTLPNARLLKYKDFEKFIWECYHRDLVAREKLPSPNFRFKLANRVAQ